MITCTVCDTPNDDLALRCSNCKSYLQGKIDTLDLFSSMWGIVESPHRTLKRVVLSQHKNYVLLLSSLFGISLVYAALWYKSAANSGEGLLSLLGLGLVLGIPGGILFLAVSAFITVVISRKLAGKATFKTVFAISAYATIPVAYALVFVFPVMMAVFGVSFFSSNPHPMVVNPIAYVILLGLDGLAWLWTLLLLMEGLSIANSFSRMKGGIAGIGILGVAGVGFLGLSLL